MHKLNIDDFDISDPPCEKWWVRYAEFCRDTTTHCEYIEEQSECPHYVPDLYYE